MQLQREIERKRERDGSGRRGELKLLGSYVIPPRDFEKRDRWTSINLANLTVHGFASVLRESKGIWRNCRVAGNADVIN